jgi:hypothetical protein
VLTKLGAGKCESVLDDKHRRFTPVGFQPFERETP